VAIAALFSIGCPESQTGPPTAHLQGTVTLGGNPIPADAMASIRFDPVGPVDSRPSSAGIQGGKYDVPDAPTGKVMVSFSISQPTGRKSGTEGRQEEELKSLVPESVKNGKEIDVTGDNLSLNFDLK
jgi:hypothetical protein